MEGNARIKYNRVREQRSSECRITECLPAGGAEFLNIGTNAIRLAAVSRSGSGRQWTRECGQASDDNSGRGDVSAVWIQAAERVPREETCDLIAVTTVRAAEWAGKAALEGPERLAFAAREVYSCVREVADQSTRAVILVQLNREFAAIFRDAALGHGRIRYSFAVLYLIRKQVNTEAGLGLLSGVLLCWIGCSGTSGNVENFPGC